MTRLALINPEGLLGNELKESLRGRRDLADEVRLLTTDEESIGAVTEGVDGAAFVQPVTDETLEGCEIVVLCAGSDTGMPGDLPPEATLIHAAPAVPIAGARVVVAGTNPWDAELGETIVNPHPAATTLVYLLDPLKTFGIEDAACWSLLPASIAGQEGVDELLEQTRSVLSFQSDLPTEIFGHQLAFSHLPSNHSSTQTGEEVATALQLDHRPPVQLLQSSCFHGITAGAHVRLDREVSTEAVLEALLDSPFVTQPDEPGLAGPVAAAGQPGLILGSVEVATDQPRTVSLWSSADNLTVAGAGNIIGILEALVAPRH